MMIKSESEDPSRPMPPPKPPSSASPCSPTTSATSSSGSSTEDGTYSSSSVVVSAAAPPAGAPSSSSSSASRYSAPLSRRTHVKSRLGCFTCKRRRVKCNEGRPICSSCRRLGLRCEYPALSSTTEPSATAANALISTSHFTPNGNGSGGRNGTNGGGPQASVSLLTLEDLRFYHQFLTVGFPALPLKADSIWPQCAAMSHKYDFLAHALLGLGASHLSQNAPGCLEYQPQALQHRITAIRRVNEELNRPKRTAEDADALFAALMCLVAQTSLLPGREGMFEYLSMGRGASLVNQTIVMGFDRGLFRQFTLQKHMEDLTSMVTEQPKDVELIHGFRDSVKGLRPLCTRPSEIAYYDNLLRAITALETSSLLAWKEFVTLFMRTTIMPQDDFLLFIEPDNYVAQLLLVHMFLVDYIIGHFGFAPDEAPKCGGRKNVIISWTRSVVDVLPEELRGLADWVVEYCAVLERQDSRHLLTP